jgi:hypothetical protein
MRITSARVALPGADVVSVRPGDRPEDDPSRVLGGVRAPLEDGPDEGPPKDRSNYIANLIARPMSSAMPSTINIQVTALANRPGFWIIGPPLVQNRPREAPSIDYITSDYHDRVIHPSSEDGCDDRWRPRAPERPPRRWICHRPPFHSQASRPPARRMPSSTRGRAQQTLFCAPRPRWPTSHGPGTASGPGCGEIDPRLVQWGY